MFIGQLLARFRPPTSEQSENKGAAIAPSESSNETRSEHFFPLTTDNPISKKNFKKALIDINDAIQNIGPSGQLLLQKAEILLHKNKFHQARQILKDLSKKKDDPTTAQTAKQLLKSSELLQEEATRNKTKKLINRLHKIAEKYDNKLHELVAAKNLSFDLEITQIVRKEAQRARASELPKLSYELIDQTLQAGHNSPWLLHDKALTLYMMGQQLKALKLLKDLKKENKGEKITNSINKNIEKIKENPKRFQAKTNIFLAKQARSIAKGSDLKTRFTPEINNIKANTKIKRLIFNEARSALDTNPQTSLHLVDSILDYFPDDLASLQLKGEVLFALKQTDEAMKICKVLTNSKNESIAKKATELIALIFMRETKSINAKKSPKAAASFFIQQYLNHNLSPILNKEAEKILLQIEPPNTDISDPELQQHQLQLLFNTLVIECLETQLRDRGRLDASATAQKSGTISKTALEAG